MYKDLTRHEAAMNEGLTSLTAAQARERLAYHTGRVRDFQHERLAHLLVTLFFGALTITSVAALYAIAPSGNVVVTATFLFTSVLLLVVELFYIGYYYLLENSVQRLYRLTERLQLRI